MLTEEPARARHHPDRRRAARRDGRRDDAARRDAGRARDARTSSARCCCSTPTRSSRRPRRARGGRRGRCRRDLAALALGASSPGSARAAPARARAALRADVRPAQALRAVPDLLLARRPPRARDSRCCACKKLYRAAGLPQDGGELPDYLPVMLEFAAAAPPGRGELVLREHRAALELVRLSPARAREPVRARARRRLRARSGSSRPAERCTCDRLLAARARRRSWSGSSRSRHPRSCPSDGGAAMSASEIFLWIVIPYVAITIFIVGHIWRYRHDQFALDQPLHAAARAPHARLGQPAVPLRRAGGHRRAHPRSCIPSSVTKAVGISEHAYHLISAIAGGIAGAAQPDRLRRACLRRLRATASRRSTTRMDYLTYLLLTVLIVLGCWMTFAHNLVTDDPYNYRPSIGGVVAGDLLPAPQRRGDRRRADSSTRCTRSSPGCSGHPSRSAGWCTRGASRCSTSAGPTSSTAAATRPRADGLHGGAHRHPRAPAGLGSPGVGGRGDGHRDRLDRAIARRLRDAVEDPASDRGGHVGGARGPGSHARGEGPCAVCDRHAQLRPR